MSLVNECPGALFKDTKFKKYFLLKSNVTNSNALITHFFIYKNLLLIVLKECFGGTR